MIEIEKREREEREREERERERERERVIRESVGVVACLPSSRASTHIRHWRPCRTCSRLQAVTLVSEGDIPHLPLLLLLAVCCCGFQRFLFPQDSPLLCAVSFPTHTCPSSLISLRLVAAHSSFSCLLSGSGCQKNGRVSMLITHSQPMALVGRFRFAHSQVSVCSGVVTASSEYRGVKRRPSWRRHSIGEGILEHCLPRRITVIACYCAPLLN